MFPDDRELEWLKKLVEYEIHCMENEKVGPMFYELVTAKKFVEYIDQISKEKGKGFLNG